LDSLSIPTRRSSDLGGPFLRPAPAGLFVRGELMLSRGPAQLRGANSTSVPRDGQTGRPRVGRTITPERDRMVKNLERLTRAAALLALAGGLSTSACIAQANYRVVAYTGQFAPGGGFYADVSQPVITPNGRVAFRGTVVGVLNPGRVYSEGFSGMQNLEVVA